MQAQALTDPPNIEQRIIENLNTAVLLFDNALRLNHINAAGEMLLAISARQGAGLTPVQLLPACDNLVEVLQRALDTNCPFTEHEMHLALPGERTITVDCTVTPLTEPRLETGLLVELIQSDHHLRISREENLLAQQQAAVALVRGLAHEIKNPLGGLRGAAQLLERELPDDGLKEYTRIIIGEADRLQNLLNRMLGPNTLPQTRMVNIHEILQHVYALVKAELSGEVTMVRDYDPSIPLVHADPDQLIQALLNIVRNATQAVDGDGQIILKTRIMRQLSIGQRWHKLVARIDVIDNGPGIPTDVMEHIFYPMVTGRPDGTGLGLSIAQSLISRHGGIIECTSEPGKTVFSVLIPVENTNG